MTREEIYNKCLNFINKNPVLLLELATGTGKSKLAIDTINALVKNKFQGQKTTMLLLVAKKVHKQTWKDEFEKWGGIKVDNVVIECYESLGKHMNETFNFILLDECHHVKSEKRINELNTLKCNYMMGLSATIPRDLKRYFKQTWKAWVISCGLTEAIEDNILPEPKIVLWPLTLDNTKENEEIVINPKVKGKAIQGKFKDRWKFKKRKDIKAVLKCTQVQKLMDMDSTIEYMKGVYMRERTKRAELSWLYLCGKRLEYLADCKVKIVKAILRKLSNQRTITFCKTIQQSEKLGSNCIHSKKKDASEIYEKFNNEEIDHITAVNILNENANLVDCKYAIFCNLSSSDIVTCQRVGRSLRHPEPILIMPYYIGTREEEIINKIIKDYNPEFIKRIRSITEITKV